MLFVLLLVACLIENSNCFILIQSVSVKRAAIPLTAEPPTLREGCSNKMSEKPEGFDAAKNEISHRESLIRKLFPSLIAFNLIVASQITSLVADAAASPVLDEVETSKPMITKKVFLNIKIANYTEESIGRNKGANGSGRVVFGLYGKNAPKSAEVFLRSILSDGSNVPSFVNSQFSRVSEEGVLQLERIRGLNSVLLAGSEQFEFGGEVMDYPPILESNNIRHSR